MRYRAGLFTIRQFIFLAFGVMLSLVFLSGCFEKPQQAQPSLLSQPSSASLAIAPVTVISDFQAVGVEAFVKAGLEAAIALYGQPQVPVRQVNVREGQSAYAALEDAAQGRFAIYLTQSARSPYFWGQLAHEVSHLLNARLFDCYVEGQSTLFAEQFLAQQRIDWSNWANYFKQGNDPFYGQTYALMRDVSAAAGAIAMQQFLSFAVSNDAGAPWQRIDIDRWIASLPPQAQSAVRATIARHYPAVELTLNDIDSRYRCLRPR